ncbi:unnamed protein product [Tenebrio molitor]|nr:unnamed protein product [Tenebrio molitor]
MLKIKGEPMFPCIVCKKLLQKKSLRRHYFTKHVSELDESSSKHRPRKRNSKPRNDQTALP